jgi:purine catabolism regulator
MITVDELEALDGLALRLVAGRAGAGRAIRWVASTELADPTPWLRGGELLLTTGLGPAEAASPAAYIERLAEAGLAGLGFAVGIRFDAIPAGLLAAADEHGFPVLEVPYATPFVAITEAAMTRIVNEQYAQLARAMEVHDALVGLVLDGAGLDAIVQATAAAVDASIVLAGRDGRVLASTGRGPAVDAAVALVVATTGAADDAALGEHAIALDVGVSSPGEAVLVAVAGRRLRDWDRVQLQQARTVLSLELAKRRAVEETERRIAGDLVDELLSGEADERQAARRLRAHGLDAAPALAVLVIRPPTARAAPALLRRVGEALGAPGVAAVRHGEVCAIVAADDDAAAERIASSLAATLGLAAGEPRIGVSRAHGRQGELREAYEEAWYALEARIGAGRDGSAVATVRDLGSVGLLLALQDERGLELFCDAALGTLEQRDRGRGGPLALTLEAFIAANGHLSDAAEHLGVHRHTLRHRLRRIEEATGRDLQSAADRLDLWLALRAREIAARRARG